MIRHRPLFSNSELQISRYRTPAGPSGGKNLAAPGEPLRAKSVTYVSGTENK